MCDIFVVKSENNEDVMARDMQFGRATGMQYGRFGAGIKLNGITSTIPFNGFFTDIKVLGKHIRAVCQGYSEYLAIGALWYRDTSFNDSLKTTDTIIDGLPLLQFLFGNAKSLSEVEKLMAGKQVTLPLEALNSFGTTQFLIYDIKNRKSKIMRLIEKDGKKGVPEFVENPGNVLTNMPNIEWHTKNLNALVGYVDSTDTIKNVKNINGYDVEFTGMGNALKGLPGSPTPEDRFARINILLDLAIKHHKPTNGIEAELLADKVLGLVQVIEGTVSDKSGLSRDWDKNWWQLIVNLKTGTAKRKLYNSLNYETLVFEPIKADLELEVA